MAKTKPKPRTWTHPRRGQFTSDEDYWTTDVHAPGFAAFCLEIGLSKSVPPAKRYLLRFKTDSGAEPTAEAIAVAERIITQPAEMVILITEALWSNFAGNPPDSEMWWHGDLPGVCENLDAPPTAARNIAPLLRLRNITIRGGDGRVAELNFWAAFEEEHDVEVLFGGVGILTDGVTVLGAGYSYDVSLYGTTYGDGDGE